MRVEVGSASNIWRVSTEFNESVAAWGAEMFANMKSFGMVTDGRTLIDPNRGTAYACTRDGIRTFRKYDAA